ncbi:MAG TPA: hypothetical protein VNO19_12895, partial [Gemmatimonadales bacterium]|nr:hypothetical protein [Gemmatimonadales bacterium]
CGWLLNDWVARLKPRAEARLPSQFEFHLRRRPPWPWIAVAVSILVHSLLLFGWVTGRLPDVPRFPRQLIVLSQPADGPDQTTMRYQLPERVGERGTTDVPAPRRRATARVEATRPELPTVPEAVTVLPKPERRDLPEADSGSTPAAVTPASRIGPGLAEGRLWVRPLPLPPQELAQRLSRSRATLVDSAVSAIVQAYLDSIANDPASKNVGLPSWTTEVAGKKFGIDAKNIYIAGLKIPAAVLALLPISGGNIDQNQAYNRLMGLRADLMYAAQRAQTLEEFKQVIREIRLRKEREREFEKNQRTAPPPETPATP